MNKKNIVLLTTLLTFVLGSCATNGEQIQSSDDSNDLSTSETVSNTSTSDSNSEEQPLYTINLTVNYFVNIYSDANEVTLLINGILPFFDPNEFGVYLIGGDIITITFYGVFETIEVEQEELGPGVLELDLTNFTLVNVSVVHPEIVEFSVTKDSEDIHILTTSDIRFNNQDLILTTVVIKENMTFGYLNTFELNTTIYGAVGAYQDDTPDGQIVTLYNYYPLLVD